LNKEEYRQEPKGNDVVVIDGLGDYLVYQGTVPVPVVNIILQKQ